MTRAAVLFKPRSGLAFFTMSNEHGLCFRLDERSKSAAAPSQENESMKTNLFKVLTIFSVFLSASISRGADIVAAGSGNWSSTVTNAPWPNGIVPGTNDDV